jgi:hypothetical protein
MSICKIEGCEKEAKLKDCCYMHYTRMQRNGSYDDRRLTIQQRFFLYVNKSSVDGCWEWTGSKERKGYGRFKIKNKKFLAHRMSYQLANGTDPGDLLVCHKCDFPSCVNPDHLFLGTASENQKDSVSKKRHVSSKKTHCKNGHALEGDNLVTSYFPKRMCRTCANDRQRKNRKKKLVSAV